MPGFDGIHNSVMKVVSDKYCGRLKCTFGICFSHGIYHKIVREKTTHETGENPDISKCILIPIYHRIFLKFLMLWYLWHLFIT